jgi:hypothetical protein
MKRVSDLVVRGSRSMPLFLLAAILGPATLAFVLFPLMEVFTVLSGGFAPFDWQPDLDRAAIAAQLPGYTPELRKLYYVHTFIDFVFPVFMALFFAAIAAYFLRLGQPSLFAICEARKLFAVFFVGAACDMLENVGALGVLWSPAGSDALWAGLLLAAKQVKLVMQQFVPFATLVAVLLGAGGWLYRRVAR